MKREDRIWQDYFVLFSLFCSHRRFCWDAPSTVLLIRVALVCVSSSLVCSVLWFHLQFPGLSALPCAA
jgi:hypothetical protein